MKTNAFRIAVVLAGALVSPVLGAAVPSPSPVPVKPAVTLGGKPFPQVAPYVSALAAPRRTRFVAAVPENGDGSEARPWNSLEAALCDLAPGDRLEVRSGTYAGGLRIDGSCRNGEADAPIQVLFGPKTIVEPGADGPALVIRRAHWRIARLALRLGDSPHAGVSIEGVGAHDVTLEGVRISGGAGPGVKISEGSRRVTIANSRIAKSELSLPGPDAVGIEIAAGAANVLLSNNRLHENPAGSVRVDAPAHGDRPASDLEVRGNTIHDDGVAAVSVANAIGVRIEDNTIFVGPGRPASSGIVLEEVYHAEVGRNHISNCAVAVQVGRVDVKENLVRSSRDVTIDHNYLDNVLSSGVAVDIEAGGSVRFVNNVVEGYPHGILVLGKQSLLKGVVVANNILLGVAETAFVLADPAVVALFDYNVFSPGGESLNVEVGGDTRALARFLKGGTMPNTRLVPSVRILDRDLARIAGVDTVDRGKPVRGIKFAGRAPDIGVAER